MVMESKMKRLGVCLLIFVLLEAICCEGCWKQEREALLRISLSELRNGTDCCQWGGVEECNSSTGRVTKLNLQSRWNSQPKLYINYSDFFVFKDLKNLDLSFNNIAGCVGNNGLENLEVLDLSHNHLDSAASILSCLDELPSLKSELNLDGNQLDSNLNLHHIQDKDGFTWPTSLQVLGLSWNSLSNRFLSFLSGLEYLESLYLSGNQFGGSLDISGLASLTSLKILDLSFNQINDIVYNQGSERQSRVEVLALDGNMINGSKLRESLRAFSSTRTLSMTESKFTGTITAGDFCDLRNLEHLTLNYSHNLQNEFLKSIGELTSLKALSVSNCGLNGSLPAADWSKLKKLEELNMEDNEFEGSLPSSFVNLTSLRLLDLSHNHFKGKLDSKFTSLTSLEYFSFTGNKFEVPVSFAPFANHSNLKFINGEGNKVIMDSQPSLQTWIPKFQLQVLSMSSTTESTFLPLPNFLLYQSNLIILDLSGWKLEGQFPYWLLENNTKMIQVILKNCSFSGTFQLPLHPLSNIQQIEMSNNIIIGQIPSNNISSIYPNLEILDLSRNKIQGSIPRELGQINLLVLDLSENQLSGEIPKDIFGIGHPLQFLKLSNNKLKGPIFTVPSHLESLLLNDNSFIGRFPNNIFNTSIVSLDINNNHLVGKIPSLIKNLSTLQVLYMSNNHFQGSIPLELGQHEYLTYLDLSQNNLVGRVPSFINPSLRFIHLNNNHLCGLSKTMFNGNSSLVMLDLSYNEISNNIEDMIHDLSYTRLNFLLLKSNHFTGDIPKQLCKLINLNILDLSHNNFSGVIPNCLGKMSFENNNSENLLGYFSGWSGPIDPYNIGLNHLPNVQEKANFTSKQRTDTYMGSILAYMSGIDLSHNQLKGNISSELGNLTRIQALNLSHNDLSEELPATFFHLVQIESLDLSFNKLSGEIPPQLSRLTSIAVFSVAHNNLSGPTVEWKRQFSTFDESSYEGNLFLCGSPLPKSCNTTPTIISKDSDVDGDNGSLVDMYAFFVSFVVSYTLALLVIATTLYINPYWRQAWFYYIELVSMNSYYFIKGIIARFQLKIFNISCMS
ncbi:hypothetical protein VNO78_15705 [Psophocarpus tetragonolobus]|uniref:Uncharacterized protein n=1 Tax=Psophocarpus tetragonolobus TaxID=3891 RepID=A0AAN9XJU7_PSOTE